MAHRTTGPLGLDRPFRLESGAVLTEFELAYETYGTLNPQRDNAILICHALTGDQYVASPNPVTGRPAWWPTMVGPGKPIDTDLYYVICSNVLGGCMGSTGPTALRDDSGTRWETDFPLITIGDMVEAQARLLDYIGIKKLFAVVGGSMGGMQTLEWLRRFPHRMDCFIAMATSYRQHVQNIAFHVAGRQAIMNDPDWRQGHYGREGVFPEKGLSVARMIAHVTYLSPENLSDKFGRRLQNTSFRAYEFGGGFRIESYLEHQGKVFAKRFDPNSYLYITQAVDFFDQSEPEAGNLDSVYQQSLCHERPCGCLITFTSDWMYPPLELRVVERALRNAGAVVECYDLEANAGHDSFLLPHSELEGNIRSFLARRRRR